MAYEVRFSPHAARQLKKLGKEIQKEVGSVIQSLSAEPRPRGHKKLKGRLGYRVRTSSFRIIYSIEDEILTVTILTVADRKQVYR